MDVIATEEVGSRRGGMVAHVRGWWVWDIHEEMKILHARTAFVEGLNLEREGWGRGTALRRWWQKY